LGLRALRYDPTSRVQLVRFNKYNELDQSNLLNKNMIYLASACRHLKKTEGESAMRIEYQCSGGYGGLRLTYQGETDALPTAEAKMLLDLIKAANVFDLNPGQISQKSRPIPDDFACRLTFSKAGKKKTLSFNELGAPKNLRRLSVHLRKLAIKKQSS
jgi:hypothetical protein